MDNCPERSSSGDMFSFPSSPVPDQDSDFEFGAVTPPDYPSSDPFKNSPADHLFFNGRLLPHAFPLRPSYSTRPASRTSSICSRDSVMSSRSNSTNSSCSSARTSSSDNSERKLLYHRRVMSKAAVSAYGSSQRWQIIATVPVPLMSRENSKRKKVEVAGKEEVKTKKKVQRRRKGTRTWFGLRVFRWFVLVCRECHALEPSRKVNGFCKET